MKLNLSLLLASGMLALTLSDAQAATVLNYAGTASAPVRSDGPYNIGSIFTVNTTGQQITHLGVMDVNSATGFASNNNGFANNGEIQVGLWSWNGTTATLLTPSNFTVGTADTYSNGYRYEQLATPVNLVMGQQYILGARVGSGIEFFLDGGSNPAQFSSSSGDFTLNNSTYSTGSFAAPTLNGVPGSLGRWGAANAIVVPEPSAALLGGLGMLALLRRRQR